MNDFIVGVPFNKCPEGLIATREDEALAIAVGAYLCGKNPLVYMQNSGLGNCFDILTSLLIPYGIKIDLLIEKRMEPEHHYLMGLKQDILMKVIGYESYRDS